MCFSAPDAPCATGGFKREARAALNEGTSVGGEGEGLALGHASFISSSTNEYTKPIHWIPQKIFKLFKKFKIIPAFHAIRAQQGIETMAAQNHRWPISAIYSKTANHSFRS